MTKLTTPNGILIRCGKTAIKFFSSSQSATPFSVLEIPTEFQNIAVEFYDLIMEYDHPTALLGCRDSYDMAVQLDDITGTMRGWHWYK